MSALLVDVDAASREDDGPSLVFPKAANGGDRANPNASSGEQTTTADGEVRMDEADDDNNNDAEAEYVNDHEDEVEDYPEVHARNGIPDIPQPAILVDSSCQDDHIGEQHCVDSPVRSQYRSGIPKGISVEAWNRAPDPPSTELFPPGSEEYDYFNKIPDNPSHNSVASAAGDDTDVSCVEKTAPVEKQVVVSFVEKPAAVEKRAVLEKEPAVVEKPSDVEEPAALEKQVVVEKPPTVDKTSDVEVPPVARTEAEASMRNSVNVVATVSGEPKTPVGPKSSDVVIIESSVEKDATTGVDTIEKRNRAKRAAKDELTPPKMKKIRVSQDTVHTKSFVQIGRFFCTYKSFVGSLKPRMPLDSQVKLIVDPATFNPKESMKDFKSAVSQYKLLKDDLFTNFRRLVNESGLAKIDWSLYNLTTRDHPQQNTTFDCGFFSILYMDQFTGKVMADFSDQEIPDLRKYLAASLINNRDNTESVEKLMDGELQVK
ncbi:hypothetical protein ACQ4PT_004545 [Festuca glaucescens]